MVECQCHRVTTEQALRAAANGCHHVRDVVKATRAGTGCGGCIPQLRALCDEWRQGQPQQGVDSVEVAV